MLAAMEPTVLIGPAVGLIGIIVSVYLWRRGRPRKGLSYRLTALDVVSVHRTAKDRVSILYDGAPVRDVRIVDLRVANIGNEAIGAGDFEEPFSVALGEGAHVLSEPTVVRAEPNDLQPRASISGNKLIIAPLLLNPGDSFQISTLVSGLKEGDRLRARISGVRTLTAETTNVTERQEVRQMRLAWFASVVTAALTLLALFAQLLSKVA